MPTKKLSPRQTDEIIYFITLLEQSRIDGQMEFIPPASYHAIIAAYSHIPKKYKEKMIKSEPRGYGKLIG